MIKVLYHRNCNDGFASAYCAWTIFGADAEYIPVQHGEPPPSVSSSDSVFVVDFSYSRQVLLEMETVAAHIVVLDHHKTAQEQLLGLKFCLFDQNKSGAMLAWEYWHPRDPAPALIQYVEDRDLWRHQLPYSEEVYCALRRYPHNFQIWHQLAQLGEAAFVEKFRREGEPLLAARKQEVEERAAAYHWEEICSYQVPVVRADRYWSDIANLLCRQHPEAAFAACYRYQDGIRKWDLRSIGDFDVSAIAKLKGGGGHKNAAGFSESLFTA